MYIKEICLRSPLYPLKSLTHVGQTQSNKTLTNTQQISTLLNWQDTAPQLISPYTWFWMIQTTWSRQIIMYLYVYHCKQTGQCNKTAAISLPPPNTCFLWVWGSSFSNFWVGWSDDLSLSIDWCVNTFLSSSMWLWCLLLCPFCVYCKVSNDKDLCQCEDDVGL